MKSLRFLLIAVFVIGAFSADCQYRPPKKQGQGFSWDKVYFGGGGGFNASSDFVNVSVSPLIGYKITEDFSAGAQIIYQYIKSGRARLDAFGGGPFLRYNFSEKFFGYTQYEYLRYKNNFVPDRTDTFNSWFVGIGYTEPVGRKLAFNITALYNVIYNDGVNTPYDSPLVFRVGIVGGLF